jgi:hypothetical protein
MDCLFHKSIAKTTESSFQLRLSFCLVLRIGIALEDHGSSRKVEGNELMRLEIVGS